MKLQQDARVLTADGQELGRIAYVVINPKTNDITHFVIRGGLIFKDERVIAFDLVQHASEDEVLLRKTADQLDDDLPPFEEQQFVRVPEDDIRQTDPARTFPLYAAPIYAYGYPPPVPGRVDNLHRDHGDQFVERKERNIPEETVALKEGARVFSSDDTHVGEIADIMVDPSTGSISHFTISQGLLFKKYKLVPVEWVRLYAEDEVYLSVSAGVLESLPDYEISA